MNLVANVIARNELDRYLLDCIEILLGFCDYVSVYDDGSTDGTTQALRGMDRVVLTEAFVSGFYEHEGRARQKSLDATLMLNPTHILAIDADEIIEDGAELRRLIEEEPTRPVWTLCMEEVWRCDEDQISVRTDGRWGPNRVPILYRVEGQNHAAFRIKDQALACGRVPEVVHRWRTTGADSGVSVLHFGWANAGDRSARYARYEEHDGGRYHDKQHLDSIMDTDVLRLQSASWVKVPKNVRRTVAARANRL